MPFIVGAIAAGTAIYGDEMSQSNAQAANAANMQMNAQNIDAAMARQTNAQQFNAQQADISRQFSAQQVQQQEQFQQSQTQQAEAYDTQMSDTAMQRRVQDLQAAGINPLLAVSQGGASAPTISAPMGSVASAAQASSSPAGQGSSIPMQNTGAAFAGLGGQMASALDASKTQANIDLLKAQTDKANEEAGTEIPANAQYLKSMTGLTDRNAEQAYYNTQRIQEQIYGERLNNDNLRDIVMPTGQVNMDVIKATRDALVSAANSDATAKALGLQQLRNLNDVASTQFGLATDYLNKLLGPVSTALQAVK